MILVTGASGNVGGALARLLWTRGVPFVVAARRVVNGAPADVDPREPGPGAVRLDFGDPSTYRGAVRGCDAVFLLRPPAVSDTKNTLVPFIDAARAEGVRHVVFLSVAGAADNRVVPHHAVEQRLLRGARGFTILRPGFFAQNLGDAYREDIRRDDRLYVPAGAGRAAFIDARDIAEVAANVLVDPTSHEAATYTLTGPEAISFEEAARVLTSELAREIRYEPASVLGYVRHLRRRGLPRMQVIVQTVLHVGLRFGQAETVDPTLDRLLGRRGRTLRDYVHDHRDLWR